MNNKPLLGLGVILLTTTAHAAQMSYADGGYLMAQYGCSSCHALDQSATGPALRDIARRYVSDPNALEYLSIHVHNGSAGVWGPLAMPPMDVPDTDLQVLLKWIMQLPLVP
jgi:cytochrome c